MENFQFLARVRYHKTVLGGGSEFRVDRQRLCVCGETCLALEVTELPKRSRMLDSASYFLFPRDSLKPQLNFLGSCGPARSQESART